MIKSKVLSSALSLAILSSGAVTNAGSSVVGQLVANPSAVVAQQIVGSQAMAYIEGDAITTGLNSSATVTLSSGNAKVVIAPNTVMSVSDASSALFSLTQGAFNVEAKEGQSVTVETQAGSFKLVSEKSVNAVVSFQNGEFAAISNGGLLTVASSDGVVTSIDVSDAFVYNDKGAQSLDVQAAGAAGAGAAGGSALATGLIVAGIIATTIVVGEEVSDSDNDDDVASPAQ